MPVALLILLCFQLAALLPPLAAQPSGAVLPPPALVSTPPSSAIFATSQPTSGFWREHWFVRELEHGNPPVSSRFRVNDPFAAFQKSYKDRKEVFANGTMQIKSATDVTTVRAAEIYLEVWGGHAGTANKRFTVNGRSTYDLPDDGTAAHLCAHQYPSVALRITDVIRGFNAFQFACDRGTSFWGHFIVEEACLRLELPQDHAELTKAGLARWAARLDAQVTAEAITLSLAGVEAEALADVVSVEFFGCYEGFDECGAGSGRQWHGFTRRRESLGHLGTVVAAPFRVKWDTSMLPAQPGVAVRAVVRFKSAPDLIYRTPVREGLEIAARPGVAVGVFGLQELPSRFWSRANRPKSAVIPLPMEPAQIERAELHTTAWAGGPGEVKEYFKLNGRHFAVADGSDHRTHYTVFPVEAALLRRGDNTVEVLSDTVHHGIEILKPGPALVVRYRTP
jgi:hypothetical protein